MAATAQCRRSSHTYCLASIGPTSLCAEIAPKPPAPKPLALAGPARVLLERPSPYPASPSPKLATPPLPSAIFNLARRMRRSPALFATMTDLPARLKIADGKDGVANFGDGLAGYELGRSSR